MNPYPAPKLNDVEIFIPSTEGMIPTYRITIPNGEYREVIVPRQAIVIAEGTPPSLIQYTFLEPGFADAMNLWDPSVAGYATLAGRGRWFVKHNGAAPVSFLVKDAGGAADLAGVAPTVITGPFNLTQIGGTAQTALDLTSRFTPPTAFTAATPWTSAAGDSGELLDANPSRKWLSAYNDGSAVNALGVKASALSSLADSFLVLGPNQGYKFQTPSEPPPTGKIRAYGSGAGSTLYLTEGT